MPWIHQFIQVDGIKMCCVSQTTLPVSMAEFADSSYIKNVRDEMLAGIIPSDCKHCFSSEEKGFASTRTHALKDWDYSAETIKPNLEYLDLRYSNLCNYSCRSCEPAFSSMIEKELTAFPILTKYYNPANNSYRHNITESITEFVDTIKRINLTGGEPLLVKENLDILSLLIDRGRTDVSILITSNMSTVNPKIMNLLEKFDNIHWTASIDAVGAASEYIRNGSKWTTVEANLRTILAAKNSVLINVTVGAYSVLELEKLTNWYMQIKKEYPDTPLDILFSPLMNPRCLRCYALPEHLGNIAKSNLNNSIELLGRSENTATLSGILSNWMHNDKLTKEFIEFTINVDNIREQDFAKTFNIRL